MKLTVPFAAFAVFLSLTSAYADNSLLIGNWKLDKTECSSGTKLFSTGPFAQTIKVNKVGLAGKATFTSDHIIAESERVLEFDKGQIKKLNNDVFVLLQANQIDQARKASNLVDKLNAGLPCKQQALKSYSVSGNTLTETVITGQGTYCEAPKTGDTTTLTFQVDKKKLKFSMPAPSVDQVSFCPAGDNLTTTYKRVN